MRIARALATMIVVCGMSPAAFADGIASPQGTDVTMTCRPLNYLLKYTALRHCSVIVWHWSDDSTPNQVIDEQFSTPGWSTRPTSQTSNPTFTQDRAAFYHPGRRRRNYDVAVPSGMTGAQFVEAVVSTGHSIYFRYYSPIGPNSNTVAAAIISRAGGKPPHVPFALGARVHH